MVFINTSAKGHTIQQTHVSVAVDEKAMQEGVRVLV